MWASHPQVGDRQPANMGQSTPQMFGHGTATASTVAPPSYSAVAGTLCLCEYQGLTDN